MKRHRIIALSGGVGGAKLALGLSRVLPPGDLTIIANTGDDFEHLGLSISPDIDTLLYTLGGLDNPATGWGQRDETWNFMASLEALGGETWFNLGDRDLATHIERTRRLHGGESLSQITEDFRRRFGIAARILPMSDDSVRTRVKTKDGWLDFQPYFVKHRCEPAITAIEFAGAADARPQPELLAALADPALGAVILCPSNPFISIEPILALSGVRAALRDCAAPVVAVSPIIGGRAIKGPTAKMMQELGLEISAAAVARRYGDLIDAYIVDHADAPSCTGLDCAIVPTKALMETLADREALARIALDAAADVLELAQ
ncbi:MAG TPA: 2-phospho-L-lactate transferase [Stellaceae bacterium]|nr:2-phospho-L-lactate transferase [Stellaceae bacterium]